MVAGTRPRSSHDGTEPDNAAVRRTHRSLHGSVTGKSAKREACLKHAVRAITDRVEPPMGIGIGSRNEDDEQRLSIAHDLLDQLRCTGGGDRLRKDTNSNAANERTENESQQRWRHETSPERKRRTHVTIPRRQGAWANGYPLPSTGTRPTTSTVQGQRTETHKQGAEHERRNKCGNAKTADTHGTDEGRRKRK